MTETRKSKRLQLLERGITKEVRMNESVNYLDYANSPLMWAAAALAVAGGSISVNSVYEKVYKGSQRVGPHHGPGT